MKQLEKSKSKSRQESLHLSTEKHNPVQTPAHQDDERESLGQLIMDNR
jgi:hypothetical protein